MARIAYLYNEREGAASDMNCDTFYIDTPTTDRQELDALLNRGGIVAGDVVCVRKRSVFGKGKQSLRVYTAILDQGATIEFHPQRKKREKPGRPSPLSDLTTDQLKAMGVVWYNAAYGLTRALERLSEIAERPVSKGQAYRRLGNRDGSKRKKKGE